MICIVCRKEVKQDEDRTMFPLERPYMNLWIHRYCWNQIKDSQKEFFTQEVVEFLYNNIVNKDKNIGKSRKRRKNG